MAAVAGSRDLLDPIDWVDSSLRSLTGAVCPEGAFLGARASPG
jgi:hypothetical protein